MDAYYHNNPRIQEWINQILEHIFTACILTGVDSETEFQKGCKIVIKLTSLLQEIPTLPSEFLEDGVKQLLEQQLPNSRVINSLPTFQPTMDRMIREGIMMVTNTPIKAEVSQLEFVTDSVIPALTQDEAQTKADTQALTDAYAQIDALTQAEINAKAEALALADALAQAEERTKSDALLLTEALAQAEAQAKSDAQAITKALAQIEALTQAEMNAKAEIHKFADALAQAEIQAKSDAQALTDALAQVDALTQAEMHAKAEALALAEVLAQAEIQAKSEALVLSEVLAQAEAKADALALSNTLAEAERQEKTNQANQLKRVLSNVFPEGTVNWNKSLMGLTFLAQVEDILICLHDPEHPCNLNKYNKDGWKVLLCSGEDLIFPRRLERGIRQIQRSGLGL